MVKEIKNTNFDQINFYPIDNDDDEIPPEIVIFKDVDSDFRIMQIVRYNDFLNSEIKKRETQTNSLKIFEWICFTIEVILVACDIGASLLGFYDQSYLPTTSVGCLLFTTLATFLRGLTKKVMKKMDVYKSLYILAKSRSNHVSDKYELAIRDGQIDHEEYLNIINEFRKYEEMRRKILQNKEI